MISKRKYLHLYAFKSFRIKYEKRNSEFPVSSVYRKKLNFSKLCLLKIWKNKRIKITWPFHQQKRHTEKKEKKAVPKMSQSESFFAFLVPFRRSIETTTLSQIPVNSPTQFPDILSYLFLLSKVSPKPFPSLPHTLDCKTLLLSSSFCITRPLNQSGNPESLCSKWRRKRNAIGQARANSWRWKGMNDKEMLKSFAKDPSLAFKTLDYQTPNYPCSLTSPLPTGPFHSFMRGESRKVYRIT